METPNRIAITICGDGGCGKSSITLRLVRSQWTSEYDPTIEDSYSITRRIDGQTYHLSLTDTAGQEEYRGMWASSNVGADAFLMVYDITNEASLDALSEFNDLINIESDNRLERLQRIEDSRRHMSRKERERLASSDPAVQAQRMRDLVTMPVKIVAGNKCDLQESRTVSSKTGLEWARRHGCGFMETSARNTVNIEETFALIVRRVVEARRIAAQDAGLISPNPPPKMPNGQQGGLGGNRNLPPAGLSFDNSAFGTGTRRAVTAPLSPLPVAEEKILEDDELPRRPWWRRWLCCR